MVCGMEVEKLYTQMVISIQEVGSATIGMVLESTLIRIKTWSTKEAGKIIENMDKVL